jgi:hypothetical protein
VERSKSVTSKRPFSDWGEELADALTIASVIFICLLFYGAIEFVRFYVWPLLRELLHYRWFALLGTITVFVVGLGLFMLKSRYQRVYGLAEVAFALAVSWSIMKNSQEIGNAGTLFTVIATAYLVVRGLSNYAEGRRSS